jgi:hypothetical protein
MSCVVADIIYESRTCGTLPLGNHRENVFSFLMTSSKYGPSGEHFIERIVEAFSRASYRVAVHSKTL